jgi:hypothetical protein
MCIGNDQRALLRSAASISVASSARLWASIRSMRGFSASLNRVWSMSLRERAVCRRPPRSRAETLFQLLLDLEEVFDLAGIDERGGVDLARDRVESNARSFRPDRRSGCRFRAA